MKLKNLSPRIRRASIAVLWAVALLFVCNINAVFSFAQHGTFAPPNEAQKEMDATTDLVASLNLDIPLDGSPRIPLPTMTEDSPGTIPGSYEDIASRYGAGPDRPVPNGYVLILPGDPDYDPRYPIRYRTPDGGIDFGYDPNYWEEMRQRVGDTDCDLMQQPQRLAVVPNVVGMTEQQARKALNGRGFPVQVWYYYTKDPGKH
ncbi:PASTA domain-containing protein, partial [Eubacteriales bacterium OttesenSCG-928-M02]|nr:PASTA domain-containing protein [Eubacteriales bacterium OttesenSCG-928-M02]